MTSALIFDIAPHFATRPNIGSVSMSVSRPESNHRRKRIKWRFFETLRFRPGAPLAAENKHKIRYLYGLWVVLYTLDYTSLASMGRPFAFI